MLSKKRLQDIIKYWKTGANESFVTMQYLYKGQRYSDCLFFGHLTLEKILKALVVLETKDY